MAWRRPGGKPLSDPMMARSLTHICVTRPQWAKLRSSQNLVVTPWIIIISLLFTNAIKYVNLVQSRHYRHYTKKINAKLELLHINIYISMWWIQIPPWKLLPKASFGIQVLLLPASVCVSLRANHELACPHDNSSTVQSRIPKFGPEMQNTLVKVPVVLWGDRPWPPRANLTLKLNCTSFGVFLHHNSLPVQARITKFVSELQNTSILINPSHFQTWLTSIFKVKSKLKVRISLQQVSPPE